MRGLRKEPRAAGESGGALEECHPCLHPVAVMAQPTLACFALCPQGVGGGQ